MRHQVITPPENSPIDLSFFKNHNRINTDDDLENALSYVHAATQLLQRITNRQFCQATIEAYADCRWHCFYLPLAPLISVTSVKYVDQHEVTQTLDTSDYSVDTTRTPGLVTIHNLPSTSNIAKPLFTIRYLAGYSTPVKIPAPLRQAIALLASNWYENRQSVNEKTLTEMPLGFQYLADSYRVYSPEGFRE